MKLWVFGDSFAEIKESGQTGQEWQIQVANALKCDLYNVAHNGSSSEWITLQLSKYWREISSEDIVIVLIPYWDRQCIFTDDPDFTHLPTIRNSNFNNRWKKYSRDQKDAFEKYFLYLHNEDLVKMKTVSLYSWINNLKLNKLPLVIETREQTVNACFDKNYNTAVGNLMDVSLAEWKDIEDWNRMTNSALFIDPRSSHLTKRNHNILASKIIKHFENNSLIDLKTDFYKEIINKDNIDIESQR